MSCPNSAPDGACASGTPVPRTRPDGAAQALAAYGEALAAYTKHGSAETLQRVFEAGRSALNAGADVFQLGLKHQEVTVDALASRSGQGRRLDFAHLLRASCASCPTWYDAAVTPSSTDEYLYDQLQISKAQRLSRANSALRHLNEMREEEARRIARELHDEAGQMLASVHLAIEDVASSLSEASRERLQSVRALLDEIEGQLRRLSHELRPAILDDVGLSAAIIYLKEGVEGRSGAIIEYIADFTERLPILVETTLYRVVQEALTNAARHSRAKHITIRLSRDEKNVTISVKDNGIGLNPASMLEHKGGLGLINIQERLEAMGGHLSLTSAPNQGTELAGSIPCPA